MIKKWSIILFSIGLTFVLFGCSKDEGDVSSPTEQDEIAEVDEAEGDEVSDGVDVGDTITNEYGSFTLVDRMTDLEEVEVGPVVVSVDRMGTAFGEVEGSFVEIIGKEELHYVQVDVQAENISDEIITFDMSKAKMVTNTGEEISSSDMLLSDFVADEIRTQVKLNGSFIYVLEESSAEDIESVRLVWDAPLDEDGETMSEAIELDVSF